MRFALPSDVTAPLYRKVLDQLRSEIRAGVLPVGATLPSEQEIGARFAVSRITVRRAMAELAQEGLLDRGVGRVARVVAPRLVQAIASFEDPFAALRLVRGTSVKLLSFQWQIAEGTVAQALQLDDGDQVLCFERLRSLGDTPVYHSLVYLPARIGQMIDRKALDGTSLHELLALAGLVPDAVERQMAAAPCPKALGRWLQVKTGTPTFRIERISRDADGQPLHLLIGHWPWDRFSMRLASSAAADGGLLTIDPLAAPAGVG